MKQMICKNIILHFGMDKTGSTSIRSSLAKNMSDNDFHYVAPGMANSSRCLSVVFRENPADFHYYKTLGMQASEVIAMREEAIASLEAQLQKATGKTAIISAEAVSGFNQSEFSNLSDFLSERCGSLTAVAYIRRPKEYMESSLQQRIKTGKIKAGKIEFNPHSLLPSYRQRFERFDQVMGKEKVKLWLFDPKAFPGGDVVQDFCLRLGIIFSPDQVIRANVGMSLPALSLMYVYHNYGPRKAPNPNSYRDNQLLINHVRKLKGPKLRLHSSLVESAIALKRDEISWMEDRLGSSMDEDLTAHDKFAISSEEELSRVPPEAVLWLAKQLGPTFVKSRHADMASTEVAEWMYLLRLKLAKDFQE